MTLNQEERLTKERAIWQAFAFSVLVDRRVFSKTSWMPHFKRLSRAIASHHHVLAAIGAEIPPGNLDPRELLVWAWCVLMAAPENTGQHYARIPERTEDAKGLQDEARGLRTRSYAMRGLDTSPEMQMRWVGGLVRAIDADLAGLDMLPSASKWKPAEWLLDGYPCYVVPVRRPYRAVDEKERTRRATLLHAILPTGFGDLEVVPVPLHGVTRSEQAQPWIYGAATFDGMTIGIDRIGSDRFRLDAAPLPRENEVLADQIAGALESCCDVLVWPELSVPKERLEAIKGMLAHDPLLDPRQVPLVVAGSWHLEAEAGWVNRTEVLHGRGRKLESYDKRRQFGFDDKAPGTDVGRPDDAAPEAVRRSEDIVAGERLLVIVTEDRLVSVAICRDFCDDCAQDVYDWLGVDLVLVPSMGDVKTMEAHQRASKTFQSQHGATSFVVQQVPVETGRARPADEPPAYSMATPLSATSANTDRRLSLDQSESFRPLRARR